jgi:hypothetical protein
MQIAILRMDPDSVAVGRRVKEETLLRRNPSNDGSMAEILRSSLLIPHCGTRRSRLGFQPNLSPQHLGESSDGLQEGDLGLVTGAGMARVGVNPART